MEVKTETKKYLILFSSNLSIASREQLFTGNGMTHGKKISPVLHWPPVQRAEPHRLSRRDERRSEKDALNPESAEKPATKPQKGTSAAWQASEQRVAAANHLPGSLVAE